MKINCTRICDLVDMSSKAIAETLKEYSYGLYEAKVGVAIYRYYSENYLGAIGRAYSSLRMAGAFLEITDDDGITLEVSGVGPVHIKRLS